MVKKLFKHEFLSLARLFVPVYAIFIAVSILGRVMQFFESDNIVYGILMVLSVVIYFIAVSALTLLTTVFCVVRYYKNMFTGEGYLTFTLPVTPTQHIMVKTVTAVAFQVMTGFMILFSLSIITMGEGLNEFIKALAYLLNMVDSQLAVHIGLYVLEFLVMLIVSGTSGILLFYTCITIGQTFRKNRVLGAVGVYFAYQVAMQTLGSIISIIASISISDEFAEKVGVFIEEHIIGFLHGVFCGSIVLTVLISFVYFLIIKSIIKNKLNLE